MRGSIGGGAGIHGRARRERRPGAAAHDLEGAHGRRPGGGAAQAATITVGAINDAPVNNLPAAQNISEDTTLVLSASNGNAISISDPDAALATMY